MNTLVSIYQMNGYRKNILRLTDDDIEEMSKQIEQEKADAT